MPGRRAQPPRLRTIPAARLVSNEVRTLIEAPIEPPARARQELIDLWASLSLSGRKVILTAARLTAMEEGKLPEGQSVIVQDVEVSRG